MSDTPTTCTRTASEAAIGQGGNCVLYWIIAARRPWWNFDLHRAVERTGELAKPVVPGDLPQAGTATAAGGDGAVDREDAYRRNESDSAFRQWALTVRSDSEFTQ